jgi:hypothetical protein
MHMKSKSTQSGNYLQGKADKELQSIAGKGASARLSLFNLHKFMMSLMVMALILLFVPSVVHAATITSSATGNWSAAGTWAAISRTGTIAYTNGSTAVVGTGTSFTTELAVGSIIITTGTGAITRTVASITDNTHLTLTTNANSTQTGKTFTAQVVPRIGDGVIISSNTTVTIDIAASCATLDFTTGTAGAASVTISGSNSLSVSGAVTIQQQGTGGSTNTVAVGAGTFSCTSVTLTATTSGSRFSQITISTGTVNVTGNITSAGTASRITFSGAGTLNAGGTFMSGTTGTFTASTGTINYNASGAQTVSNYTYYNLALSGSGTKTLPALTTIGGNLTLSGTAVATTASALTVTGNLIIGAGTTLSTGATNTWTLTVTGTTSVSGSLYLANTGNKTFTGNVTVNSPDGYWNETGIAAINYGGGLQNDGTLITNSGTHTFSGAARILSGTSTTSIANVAVTGTWTNNGTLTVGTALTGAGGLTNGTNSVLNIGGTSTITTLTATATGNTVNYSGAAQTVKSTPYYNLTFSGSGAKTLPASTAIANNLTLNGAATATTAGVLSVGGNLDVGAGTIFATGATNSWTLVVTGTTTVSGTLTLDNTGDKTFSGDVTISSGTPAGVWNETGIAAINYGGNLLNDGTYTVITGVHTFTGSGKSIGGNNAVAIPNLTISGTITNNGILTVSTALAGTGELINGTNGELNIGGTSAINTLTADAVGNTVNYEGAGQSVNALNYDNLTLSGSGQKIIGEGTVIAGNLTISGTAVANFTGTANTTNALYLLAAPQASGSWGATGSGATYMDDTYFSGTAGYVTVIQSLVPILAITAGSPDHGDACVGIAASTKTYTITNTGSVATGVSVISDNTQFIVNNLSATTITAYGGTATFDVTFTPTSSGAKTANITVSCGNGSSTAIQPLTGTGNDFPTVTFDIEPGSGPRCVGVDITYTTQATGTNYIWGFPGSGITDYSIISGGTVTDNSVKLNYLTPGSKVVTINYTSNGCTQPTPVSSTPTTVNDLPVVTFSNQPGAITVCAGIDVTYTTQPGMTSYIWGFPGTAGNDYVITTGGTGTDYSVTLNYLTPGSKIVTVNYIANSCTSVAPATSAATVVNALPTATITGTLTACGSTTLTAVTDAVTPAYVWYKDDVVISGQTASTLLVTASGAYKLEVTDGATGCINTSVGSTVVINPLPTAAISGTLTACVTTTLTALSDAVSPTYVWYKDDVVIGGQTASTLVVTVSGSYKVKVMNGTTTCEQTSGSSAVVINALPTATIGGILTACGSTTLTALTDAATPAYVWYKDDVVIPGQTASSLVVTESGAYKFEVTDGATGCINTSLGSTVVITPLPTATISGTLTTCITTTLTANSDAVSPTYVWYKDDVVIGGQTASTLVVTASGAYKVKVRNGSTTCEQTSGSSVVVINPLPTATIGGAATGCGSTTLTAQTDAASPAFVWYKDNVELIGQTLSTLYVTTAGSYRVQVTNTLTGCVNTSTVPSVVINPLPTPAIVGSAVVCNGTTGSVYNVTDVLNHTYSWSVVGGSITSGATTHEIYVTWNVAGAGTVEVTETITATGCSATMQKAVTVNALPTPVITGSGSVCTGATGSIYSVINVPGNTYSWSVNGGTITSGGITNQITITWGIAGTGTINITQGSSFGCSAAATEKSVTINALPTAGLTSSDADNSICSGDAVTFTATGGTLYEFFIDASSQGAAGGTATFTPGTLTNGQIVTVRVTNAGGCSAISTGITTAVNSLPTAGLISSDADNIMCAGDGVTFTATGGTLYEFFIDAVSQGAASASNTFFTSALTNGQVVTVKVTSASGCIATSTGITTTVNALPTVAAIGGGAASVCVNSVTPAFTNATGGGSWSILNLGGAASITSGGIATGVTAGLVSVNYKVTSGGCEITVSKALTVNALTSVGPITGPVTVSAGSTIDLGCTPSGGVWASGSPGIAIVDAETGVVTPVPGVVNGTSLISYIYTNANGCTSAANQLVTVTPSTSVENLHSNKSLTLRSYPNPFGGNTTISYTLPSDGHVTLTIRNVAGQVVKTVLNEAETTGEYTLNIEAGDLQEGVYLATLSLKSNGKEFIKTTRLVKGK